jgi:3-oxoacyl-[acyl-carrier protein] reductase
MSPDNTPAEDAHTRPVYLVTGASGAIGGAIASAAASEGAAVAVHGSTATSVDSAISKIRQRQPDPKLVPAPADFHQAGAIETMVAAVVADTGRLDAVIHCAITGAPGVTGPFRHTDPASYGAHIALVVGCFQQLCFHTLPHLSRRGGAIVTFASDAGRFPAPRQSLTGSANGGLMSFVRNLATEVARDGVRVNCISPSYVEETRAFEQYAAGGRGETARKRAGLGLPEPGDIAPLALFLCGPGAAKITGQIISINGGLNA